MQNKLPPGYTSLVPLDREKHRSMGLDMARGFGFAREMVGIYVTAHEFVQVARHYPIAFAKDGATGDFLPIAICGFQEDRNLFIDEDGGWEPGVYVPAYLRRWPFFPVTAKTSDDEDAETRDVICVDESALVEGGEHRIFDDQGEPTDLWRRYESLINDLQGARTITAQLTRSIQGLELFRPFEAHAHPKSGGEMRLRGLFRVDEPAVQELDGKQLKRLVKRGELARIYAHLMSLDNFKFLLDRSAGAHPAPLHDR